MYIKRCGNCLFAEGGWEVKFNNGAKNFAFHCTCIHRDSNIVLLEHKDNNFIVFANQKACINFVPSTSKLKKRCDLDEEEYYFKCDGHFEIIHDEQ